MRRLSALFLLAALCSAQDKPAKAEPGLVSPGVVRLGALVPHASKGSPEDALALYRTAHKAHVDGDLDAALRGYVACMGSAGLSGLPPRYAATVCRCVDDLRAGVRARYQKICALYSKDRKGGLEALAAFAARYAYLPEGKAARVLEESDGLRFAEQEADRLAKAGEKGRAKETLLQAIRACPEGLYLHESKKRLIDLGGPDLLTPEERVVPKDRGSGDGTEKKTEDSGAKSTIEFHDDGKKKSSK